MTFAISLSLLPEMHFYKQKNKKKKRDWNSFLCKMECKIFLPFHFLGRTS